MSAPGGIRIRVRPGEPILRIIDMGFDVTITSPGNELETQAW